MKRLPELQINAFQLAVLLNEEEMYFYNLVLENNIYCSVCRDTASRGVDVKEKFLTDLNDVRVRGTCRVCMGEVGRLFEFGSNKDFQRRARSFRSSLSPLLTEGNP